jgi:hypothetical protein
MKFAFRNLTLAALVLAVMAVAQSASAGTITQTVSYTGGSPPFTDVLTFNKFNTALGTLTSVSIELSETSTLSSSVFNSTSSAVSFSNATTSATVTATGPDSTTSTATVTSDPFAGTATPNGFTNGPSTTATATATSFAASLAPYEGAGTGTFTVSTSAAALAYTGDAAVAGALFFGGPATASGSVTIIYTYTSAIPEPASLGMVALGLGGIFAVRRFRSKVA